MKPTSDNPDSDDIQASDVTLEGTGNKKSKRHLSAVMHVTANNDTVDKDISTSNSSAEDKGQHSQTLLRQLGRLRRELAVADGGQGATDASQALDVLETDLKRSGEGAGHSCNVGKMVCTELPPLSSCRGTSAGRCQGKRQQGKAGMMVALLVPIAITAFGIIVYLLFWKRIGNQVDVEQPCAARISSKKAEAGGSQTVTA